MLGAYMSVWINLNKVIKALVEDKLACTAATLTEIRFNEQNTDIKGQVAADLDVSVRSSNLEKNVEK